MIDELDAALRTLVEQEVLNGSGVEVQFDAPTKDWAARRNQPTIDIYLYDIRQDLSRRQFGIVEQTDEAGTVEQRRRIPTWFRVSYLVTAWTQRPEDEHRLLSALLSCFLRHERVPPDLLSGSLAELEMSVPLSVALPPPQDRALSDVWSALGGELKPSLDINVIAPMLPDVYDEVGPPVTREPALTFVDLTSGAREDVGNRPVPGSRHQRVHEIGRRPPPPLDDPARPPRPAAAPRSNQRPSRRRRADG